LEIKAISTSEFLVCWFFATHPERMAFSILIPFLIQSETKFCDIFIAVSV